MGDQRGIVLTKINLGRSHRRRGRRHIDPRQQHNDFNDGERHLNDAIERIEKVGIEVDVYYQIEAHNEIGCLYRDWIASLGTSNPEDPRIVYFLDKAEEHLHHAIHLSHGEDPERLLYPLQYIDSLEDQARVHYWRSRTGNPCDEGEPLQVMADLLDKAETMAQQWLDGWDELRLILGKIHFQRARLAQEARDQLSYQREIAEQYALAAAFAESYSSYTPELEKFIHDASEWLCSLDNKEAAVHISYMRTAVMRAGLESRALRDQIDSEVLPKLGVDWEGTGEVSV